MKMLFKITSAVLAASLLCIAQPRPARAEQVYWTTRKLLADFFPRSERVSFKRFELDAPLRERLRRRLGYLPTRSTYTIYTASTGERIDGYALVDDQLGQHEPITFAVKLSPRAVVERQEIVAYRESRGDEVVDARFRSQFVGKGARDPVRLSEDISAISGATISSSAMATGVRRAIALVEEFVASGSARASAASVPGRAAP